MDAPPFVSDSIRFGLNFKRLKTQHLTLLRPATIDLILTKMMRGSDDQDMEDVEFLATVDRITIDQIETAFTAVNLPEVPELREAFRHAMPIVREIVKRRK